ncbi:MAG: ATP-binding cassette domain-containing protein [Oscillospiraceae bacterium]
MLQFRGVTKAFGERTLFSDVYLRVEGGERIALLGENGTGKTTLLNMLTGRESCDGGFIRLGPSVKWAYLPQVIHFDHPERSWWTPCSTSWISRPSRPATVWRPISLPARMCSSPSPCCPAAS